MTELELRTKVADLAKSFNGCKQGDSIHKSIIDYWNSMSGIPGKAGYKTAWCAIFVSVVFDKAGLGALVKPEWNVAKMRDNFISLGLWQENENICPEVGWIVVYNWDDGTNYATTDNKGSGDHVGIVVSVSDTKKSFVVQEGNRAEACSQRRMNVNGRYLRGFCKPDFASKATKAKTSTSKTITTGVVPAQSFNAKIAGTYQVNAANGLNFRKGPSVNYGVIKVLKNGEKVTNYGYYTRKNGINWYYVQAGNYIGYVSAYYLTKVK